MSLPTLLISDLHLEASRPELTAALGRLLEQYRGRCARLFILGDLFEAWIGDDDTSALADEVARELSAFAAAGAEIGLMHGNRDFLIGADYARRCSARLMPESEIISSGNQRFLLLHGDSLCTDDTGYQAFRQLVRQSEWQAQFLGQSLDARRAFAAQARTESKAATADKANEIMDVNAAAVREALSAACVSQMIHGHTHRPKAHSVDTGSTRTVLGDWHDGAWIGLLQDGVLELSYFDFKSIK